MAVQHELLLADGGALDILSLHRLQTGIRLRHSPSIKKACELGVNGVGPLSALSDAAKELPFYRLASFPIRRQILHEEEQIKHDITKCYVTGDSVMIACCSSLAHTICCSVI